MLDAVGAGFIAGGAILLLTTFLGGDPGEAFSEVERSRRERNAWLASRASAVATAAGAVLLLIPTSHWWVSLLGTVAVLLACWLLLAAKIHREYRVALSRALAAEAAGGTVTHYDEMVLGLEQQMPYDEMLAAMKLNAGRPIDVILARARERASWRWALRHPTGVRNRGM